MAKHNYSMIPFCIFTSIINKNGLQKYKTTINTQSIWWARGSELSTIKIYTIKEKDN